MRNLKILNEILASMELSSEKSEIIATTYDALEKHIYIFTSDGYLIQFEVDLEMNELLEISKLKIPSNSKTGNKALNLVVQRFNEVIFVVFPDRVLSVDMTKSSDQILTIFEIKSHLNNTEDSKNNEEEILTCQGSPDEELFVVVTSKGRALLLNRLFKIKRETQLNQNHTDICSAFVEWRFDSLFFQINYKVIGKGRVIISFEAGLELHQSPSKYDPAYPLVRNVFENPRKKLGHQMAWNPHGRLTYGVIQQTIVQEKGLESKFYI